VVGKADTAMPLAAFADFWNLRNFSLLINFIWPQHSG
jgi:hypothetical protein